MEGLGIAEDHLIKVICQLYIGNRHKGKEASNRMYDRGLTDLVKSEASDDSRRALTCMLAAEESELNIEADWIPQGYK